jgi:hypothetical protein
MLLELPLSLAGCAIAVTLVSADALTAVSGGAVDPTLRTFVGGTIGALSLYGTAASATAFRPGLLRAAWLLLAVAVTVMLAGTFGSIARVAHDTASAIAAVAFAMLTVAAPVAAFWSSR